MKSLARCWTYGGPLGFVLITGSWDVVRDAVRQREDLTQGPPVFWEQVLLLNRRKELVLILVISIPFLTLFNCFSKNKTDKKPSQIH